MEKYLVIIGKAGNNYSAFSPDVPGCIATGGTIEETTVNMKEALVFHVEDLEEIPQAKGIPQHIANGVLDKEPGDGNAKYYMVEVEIEIPQHA